MHRTALRLVTAVMATSITLAAVPAAFAIVTGAGIRDSSVTTLDIARDTLIGADIRTNAVGTLELAPNAVRTSDILDQSIGARDLGVNSVGSSEIGADAVGASELAAGSVGNAELGTNSVTRPKVGDDAIGAAELDENAVSGGHVVANSIGASDIAVNGVGASEIATGGVTTAEVLDGTIGSADIAVGAVTTDRLAAAPGVALGFAAAQSIPANTPTMVLPAGGWGEQYDQGSMYDEAADPAYLVAPVAGWYHVSGRLEWSADALGAVQDRRLSIMTATSTGTDIRAAARVQDRPQQAEAQQQSVDGLVRLAAGDRIWLEAQQSNDGDDPIAVGADVSIDTRGAAFRAVWVGA